jgi:hypothetical protein
MLPKIIVENPLQGLAPGELQQQRAEIKYTHTHSAVRYFIISERCVSCLKLATIPSGALR